MCGKAVLGRYALQHKLIDLGGCIAALETDCRAEVCPVEKEKDNRIDIEFEYTSLEVLGDFTGFFMASLSIQ